jgi:hypothetical protein
MTSPMTNVEPVSTDFVALPAYRSMMDRKSLGVT